MTAISYCLRNSVINAANKSYLRAVLLTTLVCLCGISTTHAGDVIAVYYGWYQGPDKIPAEIPSSICNPGWEHWAQCDHDYEGLTYTLPDNPATIFIPTLGFYSSSTPRIARQHVLWAKEAGLDAFAISTFPPKEWYQKWGIEAGVPWTSSYEALFQAAQAEGFHLCFHLEGAHVDPDTGKTWEGYTFKDLEQAQAIGKEITYYLVPVAGSDFSKKEVQKGSLFLLSCGWYRPMRKEQAHAITQYRARLF